MNKLKLIGVVLLMGLISIVSFTAGAMMDYSTHEFGHMNHGEEEKYFEASDRENPPLVSNLIVTEDVMGGWNLFFEYENFDFAPKKASLDHEDNQGHAHLHINGDKYARLYSDAFHIQSLPKGDSVISVYLNTNDHKEYVVDGAGTGMEIIVTN